MNIKEEKIKNKYEETLNKHISQNKLRRKRESDFEHCNFNVKKIFIDNGAIEQYLNTQKSFGNKFSLDCNASYVRMGLLIILFLLF